MRENNGAHHHHHHHKLQLPDFYDFLHAARMRRRSAQARYHTGALSSYRIVVMIHLARDDASDGQASRHLDAPNLDTSARQVLDAQGGWMESISARPCAGRLGLAMFFERIMSESKLAFGDTMPNSFRSCVS